MTIRINVPLVRIANDVLHHQNYTTKVMVEEVIAPIEAIADRDRIIISMKKMIRRLL